VGDGREGAVVTDSAVSWDVVVVGCGAAALSAGLSALEQSADRGMPLRVCILERTAPGDRGGSTAWTTSQFRLDTDYQLHPSVLENIIAHAGERANLEYLDVLQEETPTTLDFLRRHGIKLGRRSGAFAVSFGPSTFVEGGGRAIVDHLAGAFEAAGGTITYETTALHLSIGEDGYVDGVVVSDAEGRIRPIRAQRVVLACGGFEGNPEMMTRYLGHHAATMNPVSPGSRANRGDGIRMAVEVGADTAGEFDNFHGEPVDPRSANMEAVQAGYLFSILVNGDGERFIDEGSDTMDNTFDRIAVEIFRHQDQRAFAIYDQRVREANPIGIAAFNTEQHSFRADTLEELAMAIAVDAAKLEATVAAYNAAVQDGPYDPMRLDGKGTIGLEPPKSNWALPIDTPPFEAQPVVCNICFTFGGLRTDGWARVVDAAGRPIRNLYAAGELAGLYYGMYNGGHSVLRSLTFGRRAGEHVVDELLASPA
jgi:tricarballylate dehydrogenase